MKNFTVVSKLKYTGLMGRYRPEFVTIVKNDVQLELTGEEYAELTDTMNGKRKK